MGREAALFACLSGESGISKEGKVCQTQEAALRAAYKMTLFFTPRFSV